nr:reverse transcriptase domain-containing protein [Tanacetum cinerariifolium]
MDDEPMWAADHVVAPTLDSAITILETTNEFAIKGNHLTRVKGNQFDGRTKTNPHKHIHEFLGIYDLFKYRDTKNEAVRLIMFPLSLTGEAKTWLNIIKTYGLSETTQKVLNVAGGVIRVKQKQLNLGVGTERMIFNIDSAIKHSYSNDDTCFSIDVIDEILKQDFVALLDEGSKILHSIEGTLLKEEIFAEFDKFMTMTIDENCDSESDTDEPTFKKITINTNNKIKTSLEEPPTDLELKPFLDNLEYVFLEEPSFLPIIISSQLSKENKKNLYPFLKSISKPLLQKQQTFLEFVRHSANTRYNFWMTRNQLSKNKEG